MLTGPNAILTSLTLIILSGCSGGNGGTDSGTSGGTSENGGSDASAPASGTGTDTLPYGWEAPPVMPQVQVIVRGARASSLALDSTYIYWTDSEPDNSASIMRAPKTGLASATIMASNLGYISVSNAGYNQNVVNRIGGIAVGSSNVYWTNLSEHASIMSIPVSVTSTIVFNGYNGGANISGDQLATWNVGSYQPEALSSLVTSGGALYWIENDDISDYEAKTSIVEMQTTSPYTQRTYSSDSSSLTETVGLGGYSNMNNFANFAVDSLSGFLFWINPGPSSWFQCYGCGQIVKLAMTYLGTSATTDSLPTVVTASSIRSFVIDSASGTLYGITPVDPTSGYASVMAISEVGGAATVLATTTQEPAGIAIDATDVYWTQADGVMTVPKTGGSVAVVSDGAASVIVADSTGVYWNSFGYGIGKLAKH